MDGTGQVSHDSEVVYWPLSIFLWQIGSYKPEHEESCQLCDVVRTSRSGRQSAYGEHLLPPDTLAVLIEGVVHHCHRPMCLVDDAGSAVLYQQTCFLAATFKQRLIEFIDAAYHYASTHICLVKSVTAVHPVYT